MHFTSAFIPTLLFASTVLATREPYAGYKKVLEREVWEVQPWVSSVAAIVTLPKFPDVPRGCNPPRVAFIALGIGDPRSPACNSAVNADGTLVLGSGFEAGITFTCSRNRLPLFKFYSRKYPLGAETDEFQDVILAEGDDVRMEILIDYRHEVWFSFSNPTRGQSNRWIKIGDATSVGNKCLATAMWVLKAALRKDRTGYRKLPMFESIIFRNIRARDNHRRDVGYTVPQEAQGVELWEPNQTPGRLIMWNSDTRYLGGLMAAPFKVEGDPEERSFKVFRYSL